MMPPLDVRAAARLTGKNRSTITRAIERGRLPATRNGRGRYLIEAAELERVFGIREPHARTTDASRSVSDAPHRSAPVGEDAVARELATFRQEAVLREVLERERAAYERERRSWEDERAFLRALVRELTSELARLAEQEVARRERFGWLRRLFGAGGRGGSS